MKLPFQPPVDRQSSTIWNLRLRTLLVACLVLPILGTVGLVEYLAYRSGKAAIENLAEQLIDSTASRVEERLNIFLGEAQRLLTLHRLAAENQRVDLNNFAELEAYFLARLELYGQFTALGFANDEGESLIVGLNKYDLFEPDYDIIIAETTNQQPGENFFYGLNDQGDRTFLQTHSGYDPRQLTWYQLALEQGQTWTPIYPVALAPIASSMAVAPVEVDGEFQGVLFVNITLDDISDFLNALILQLPSEGQIFIIERSGDLVATSTQEPVYQVDATAEENQLVRLNALEKEGTIVQATMAAILAQAGDLRNLQAEQFELVGRGGEASNGLGVGKRQRYFVNVSPYQNDYGLDWLIVTVVPESAFTSEIAANMQRTVGISLLALFGAIALGLWLTRRIERPILALNQATQAFARGDLHPQTRMTYIREIESLRQAFHRMASQLDESLQTIKANEQTLSTLLDKMPLGVNVLDTSGKILLANRVAYDIFTQGVVHTSLADLVTAYQVYRTGTDELYPNEQLPIMRALQGESVYADDVDIVRADGRRIPLEVHTAPVFNDAGQVIYVINAFQEITERREAERLRANYQQDLEREVDAKTRALQDRENQLKEAQRIAQTGSWELDVVAGKNVWSEELYRILGWQEGQLSIDYPDLLKMIPEEDRASLENAVAAAIAHGTPYAVEHRIARSDGALCYIVSRGEAVCDDQGHVVKLRGTASDITDRKLLELALRESETRLNDILNTANAAISRMQVFEDGRWVLLYVADGCEIVTGYTVADLMADQELWVRRIYPGDWDAIAPQVFADIFAAQPGTYEYRMFDKAERVRWISQTNHSRYDQYQNCWFVTAVSADITQRKQAELALQQSEAKLQLITDSIPGCISYIDASQRYQFVNRTYEEWFNCQKADILGRTVEEVIGTDAYLLARPYVEQALAGETVNYETQLPYQGGIPRYVSGVLVPDRDDQGQVRGYYALITDISDRKRAEELLRQSEARYLAILEDQTELIKRFRPDGTILFVNDALCRYYGLSKHEVMAQGYQPPIHPEDQARVTAGISQLSPQNPVFSVEHRVIAKGQVRWMQWSNRAIFDSWGKLVELQAVGRDIDDQKQAELALKYTTQQLQAFLDNAPAAISQFDETGRYWLVNQRFAAVFQQSTSQLVGKTFADLFPPETVQLFGTRLLSLADTQQPMEVEDEVEIDGDRRIFRSILFPILSDQAQAERPQRFWAIATDITERKRIENQLKEKTEELDRFFAVALDLLCITDTDGYFRRLNRQWEKTLGYPLEEMEGSRFIDYVHPDDVDITLYVLAGLTEQRKVNNFVNRYRCQNGTYRWIEWQAVPVGKLVYAAARDITNRKEAELFLQDSEEMLATVFHANPTPCWIATLEGRFVEVNEGFSRFYGMPVEKLVGKTYADLQLWDDPRNYQAFQQILNTTKRLHDFEVVLRTAVGVRHTVVMAASMTQLNGKDRIVGVFSDISDRKQAEIALHEKIEELDRFFSAAIDLLCIANTEGYFLRLNPEWEKTLGYPLHELEGRQFLDYVHPEDIDSTLEAMSALDQGQEVPKFINRYRCRDGSYRWIEWRSIPIGKLIYATARDISDRIQSEQHLQQALSEKEILLQEIHHRVKNNLQLIQSMLQMQTRRIANPDIVQVMEDSQNRIAAISLAHKILYQSDNLSQIDLATYLQDLVQEIRSLHDTLTKPIAIEAQFDSIVVPIKTATCYGLILNELLANAFKHAFPETRDGIQNRIVMKLIIEQTEPRPTIHLFVHDNGVGLPPGFSLENQESLGMILVQALTEQLYGFLELTSEQGTQFHLSFPAIDPSKSTLR
jgi:PAS domain S-box-containing protein